MPAEGRENPLLKKGNSDAFFREKYLTKNTFTIMTGLVRIAGKLRGDLRPNGKQQSGNGISV